MLLATPVDLRLLPGYSGRQLLRGAALVVAAGGLLAWSGWFNALNVFTLLIVAYLPVYLAVLLIARYVAQRVPLLVVALAILLVGALAAVLAVQLYGWMNVRMNAVVTLPAYGAFVLAVGFATGMVLPELWQQHRRQVELRWLREREARVSLEKSLLESELRALQAQVEPHFLYNTLANVQYLIRHQPEQAERMLGHFVAYLRNVLPDWAAPVSTVGRECQLVADYLAIMAIRMGGRLRFEVHCPAELEALDFPPLMLISLVENAVRHGVEPKPGPGLIHVSAARSDDRLSLRVQDDGVGLGSDSSGSGVGLSNIRQRLAAMFGDAGRLSLETNESGGIDAELIVPVTTS